MIDLLQAAQDAAFAALKPIEALPGLPAGMQVFQHVPQDTQPPMIVLGMMTSDDAGEKGEQVEEITLEVQYVYRGPGRAPLLAMMHAGRTALDRQEISIDGSGALLEYPRFVSAEAGDAIADGVTYVGLQVFKFYAWPG